MRTEMRSIKDETRKRRADGFDQSARCDNTQQFRLLPTVPKMKMIGDNKDQLNCLNVQRIRTKNEKSINSHLVIHSNDLLRNDRSDNDRTLIKLLIPALLFSTGSDLYITTTENEIHIQNFYCEVLFKYMIYRNDYKEAGLRFAKLIKSSLDQSICALSATEIQKHEQLIRTVVKQTEQSLILQKDII